jgi:hypothetical protein
MRDKATRFDEPPRERDDPKKGAGRGSSETFPEGGPRMANGEEVEESIGWKTPRFSENGLS